MDKLCIFLVFIGCFTTTLGRHIEKIDGSKLSSDSLETKIHYLMEQAKVTGLAISIFNHNFPFYVKSFGLSNSETDEPLNTNSVFVAASFSKMVFAYIVMQLVAEELIDLDTPIVNYLKEPLTEYQFTDPNRGYKDLEEDCRYELITARMCLTHTTGLPNWRWYEEDNKLKFLFEPGTRFRYSGEGLFLLQFIIEQILEKDFESIAQERVFKPLRMENSSFVWQEQYGRLHANGHNSDEEPIEIQRKLKPDAASSLTTTINDFTKFYATLIKAKGLKKNLFKEMTNLQVSIKSMRQFGPLSMTDTNENEEIDLGYGFGVGVLTSPYGKAFFKEGNSDGWQHYTICFTEKKIAIIIMTNSDNGDSIFKELLEFAIGDKYTPWKWENYIPYNSN